jgi:microcystin-dependent protein
MTYHFTAPQFRARDINDGTLAAAKLYFYAAGTSSQRTTYQDRALTVPHAHPILADANGDFPVIFLKPSDGPYKVDLKTAAGVSVAGYPVDNLEGPFDSAAISVLFAKPLRPVVFKTGSFTVVSADMGNHYECDATSATIVATLPAASTVNQKVLSFRKTSAAGSVTIRAVGGDLIAGATASGATYQITTRGAEVAVFSTGTGWVAFEHIPLTDGAITAAMLSGSLSGAFVQTGSVIPWMHATVPANYLECNGAAVSRTTYAALFAVLGTTYGPGDGSTTFNLPDLRGLFLRGQNNGRTGTYADPNAATRANRGDGTTGDNVGTLQEDETGAHSHTGTTDSAGAHTHTVPQSDAGNIGQDGSNRRTVSTSDTNTGSAGAHTHAFTTDASGGSETRPSNIAVKWIIFAGGAGAGATYAPMLRHGVGAPADSVGSDDDFYLDVSTYRIWGPKAGGTWSGTDAEIAVHLGFSYTFSTATTDSDPGVGTIRLNHATPASATQIFISETDGNGTGIAASIAAWFNYGSSSARGTLRLIKYGDHSVFADYTVTGTNTDAGGYDKISVTYVSGNGAFTNFDGVAVVFSGAGPQGGTGATGAAGANGTDPGVRWLFDAGTSMADPGAGDLRLNNATLSSVTAIAISYQTGETGNPSLAEWVKGFDDSSSTIKGQLTIKKSSAPQNVTIFNITALADNTSWAQLTVAHVASSGSFSDADVLSVQFTRQGDAGTGAVSSVFGASGAVTMGSLTSETVLDKADTFPFFDQSASAHRSGTFENLYRAATTLTAETAPAVDDEIPLYDLSATAARKMQLQNALKVVNGLAAETTHVPGDFLLLYDTSAGAVKKIDVKTIGTGKQMTVIPAPAMVARTTNGATAGTVEMTNNKQMLKTLDFDATTQEFAQFVIARMPKSWNLGTVTYQAVWSHAATATNFGVTWGLEAVAIGNDDALDVAWGTAVNVTDTGGTTNDVYHASESAAVTIAGTPAEGDSVWFQVKRVPADAGDTMAIDARLVGVALFFTTNANTEA